MHGDNCASLLPSTTIWRVCSQSASDSYRRSSVHRCGRCCSLSTCDAIRQWLWCRRTRGTRLIGLRARAVAQQRERQNRIGSQVVCRTCAAIWQSGRSTSHRIWVFLPNSSTLGSFFIIHQPMCAKKKPRFEFLGSAIVSDHLWCVRWSRTYEKMLPFTDIVCNIIRMNRSSQWALNERWAHSRWEPTRMPTKQNILDKSLITLQRRLLGL